MKYRDELTVMAKMIDESSHAASAVAKGIASRGNRSSLEAGVSSLPRRRVIRAHVSRVAKTCRNLYKVKHKLEYPDHTVYPYMT